MPNMKPILFSTPMVQAILAGYKTMTRRVITNKDFQLWVCSGFSDEFIKNSDNKLVEKAPIKLGDILWVRETWRITQTDIEESEIRVQYKADMSTSGTIVIDDDLHERYSAQCAEDCEKAGLALGENDYYVIEGEDPSRWRPSIFMPKAAARIFLRVTCVRAERLQDITEEDAVREGVMGLIDKILQGLTGKTRFERLWDRLNKKRGYGWDTNPWVWVYTFERITREEAQA